ncbi:MAG TPA: preprotein translocase subunit YajC [Oligoflexus sp.]|uniref:preprotein translocase subunit YajC n=1 Tax=Oligoflexus sp. TaxID=1971216 RepID=UPI002D5A7503|nr:preprotein translocase subunit YajC [Oligoflexus sp.]HYX35015.1 preprotein translocase subunit YajC [Oligoflexus sp.]
MSLFSLMDVAYAQGGKPAQPSTLEILIMPLAFIVIMYFLVIRPQQKKAKDHQALLTALKVGDEVVTTGGIIGRIKTMADTFVTLDAGPNTTLKVQKSHITAAPKAAVAKAEK